MFLTEFSSWQEERIEQTENLLVEEEIRYKWYIEEKESGGYNSDYPLTDYEDYIYTEYSSWNTELPPEDSIQEEKTIYKYQTINPIRYIKIDNLYGSYDCFRITELKVKINNKYIDYKPTCNNCSASKTNYLYNGIINENIFYLLNNGYLQIDLIKEYNIWDIEIEVYLYDRAYETKAYTINYINNNKIYAKKAFLNSFRSEYLKGSKFIYSAEASWIENPEYSEPAETEDLIKENFYTKVDTYKLYRYKTKQYMHYKITRKYVEGYHLYIKGYIKDEMNYKIYYRYKEVEKEKIEDETIINKNEEISVKKEQIKNETILNKINYKTILIILGIVFLLSMIVF